MSPRLTTELGWKIAAASVPGFSHQDENSPCQDYYLTSVVGSRLIAIVSDGAGSAALPDVGARKICHGLVRHLSDCITTARSDDVIREASSWISAGIELVRSELGEEALSAGLVLSDFHATLVGALVSDEGGIFFHIGDGAACALKASEPSANVVSAPENGEFADETYFYTQSNWREHLRLLPFGPEYNVIALMTDGVTPFALSSPAPAPHAPFFEPLTRFLRDHSPKEGSTALASTLDDDAIRSITGDDKTLVWAIRLERDA